MSNKLNIKFETDFTVVPNRIFRDNRLSFKAKGIFIQIISLAESWNFSIGGLAKLAKESNTAVQSGIDELIACGYLEWIKYTDDLGRFSVEINVFLPCEETTSGGKPVGSIVDNKERTNKESISNKEITNIFGDFSNRDIVPVKKERPRDLIWEALLDACGMSSSKLTTPERSRTNTACKELKLVGATPEEIYHKVQLFKILWPGIKVTPMALVNRWSECEDANAMGLFSSKARDKELDKLKVEQDRKAQDEQIFRDMVARGVIDEFGNEIKKKEIN